MLNRNLLTGTVALLALIAVGCQMTGQQGGQQGAANNPLANPADVDHERLLKGTTDTSTWAHYGGSYNEQRFSPLKQINDGNIANLGLAFYADYRTNQNQHGSPLYVDGVIYVSTARNVVHAFDARDGKELWTYHPSMVPNPNLGMVNKGIAAWNGTIYMGQLDAKLVAIDAKTGKAKWTVDTVPPGTPVPEALRSQYSLSMAPRVAKGKVFIGGSGGEFGARGWIAAFDAQTGKEAWRFWTVPGDPAFGPDQPHLVQARKTWPQDRKYWEQGGGGTIWDAIVYDPETDLLYFGTGNGTPWNRQMRDATDGDNLYVASIVAVNPDTGRYVWHYQATPGDSWDYDNVSPMFTADLTFQGQQRHVLVQPSKNGFIYVLDAKTGKFISGDAFTGVTWASGIDANGRPIEVPGARYETEPFNIGPGAPGGHTWHPNAFSPDTGLVYIPTWENYSPMSPQVMPASGVPPLIAMGGAGINRATLKPHNKTNNDGWLQAWDPVARKMVWETPRGPRATRGAMATAGNLVFMGNSGGKKLAAYNAKNGTKLWEFDAQTDVYAAPITYELDGVQYIAASVGGTGQGDYFAPSYGRMLVFKVGGTATLPPNAPFTPRVLNPPALTASPEVVAAGNRLYAENCAVCHGANGTPGRGGNGPNLTTTPFLHSQAGFDQVVLHGASLDRGMLNFGDKLRPADSAAVLAYIVSRANEIKNAPPPPPRGGGGPRGGGPGAGGPPPVR
ncbi:MAG TPA: PQQ-dependent dehydrogenase, methanol/ethanol family [Steroidobacteraceae bacterium]|nr:PQQ-dependent dehydrogenase, methanol/ethanol family [Steroidobacteraceae bacterium]